MTKPQVTFYTGAKSSNGRQDGRYCVEGTRDGLPGEDKGGFQVPGQDGARVKVTSLHSAGSSCSSELSSANETDSSIVHGSVESGR